MELKLTNNINKHYAINKAEIENVLQPKDTIKTDDKNSGNNIKPYISVGLCDNLIYQNVLLYTCIETLAKDTIYNNIHITSDNQNEDIKKFWLTNQDELKKAYIDWYSYGFGACEVILDTITGLPLELYEIQADTLYIKKRQLYDEEGIKKDYYYVVQQVNGVDKTFMKLFNHEKLIGYDYLPQDENLHTALWIGGGRKSLFYDYPYWISAFNHVSASVSLDMLDSDKIANGNLISGILTIIRPPINKQFEEDVEDMLEEKMQNKGSGVFTLELNTLNTDIPLTVDYIKISEDNFQYLNELSEKCDKKILAVFKIPKARLLIDDTTESMNSNKTNTLYKIYSKELEIQQRPLEIQMDNFNKYYFEADTVTDIETPIFVDDKEIEVDTIIKLFNNGLITLGQAIKKLNNIYPEYEIFMDNEIDFNNPIYDDRFYNGNPLGLNEDNENPVEKVGEFVDYFQVN